jgi:hypothetical protein
MVASWVPKYAQRENVATKLEHCSHRGSRRVGWILPLYGLVLTTFSSHQANRSAPAGVNFM